LSKVDLLGANLSQAILDVANLYSANLSTTVALCWRQSPLEPVRSQTQELGSGDVGLEGGRHLLEPGDRELVRTAKRAHILMPVDTTIGQPTAAGAPFVAVGAPAPLLTQEAQGGDGLQPGKPFGRIREEGQFSELGTDDDVGAIRAVFD
jgi:hypothetical protein